MIVFNVNTSSKQQSQLRESYPKQTFQFCQNMSEAEKYLAKAKVLITFGGDVTTELIEKSDRLNWIMVFSAGMEQMPFEIIKKRDILVTNVRGIHKVSMAEYVISMLLQVYRQEKVLIENERKNKWDKTLKMQEITGKTMLIVGTGAIGQEVARLAKAFQMTTYGISRSGMQVESIDKTFKLKELNRILQKVDFVVSVLPSTKETKGLFTSNEFNNMQDHAVFLNMGRGDVVRNEDLLTAVKEQKIAHAILDVIDVEPLPEDHPFWSVENITVTPHLSGESTEYLTRSLDIFTKNLQVYIDGKGSYINKINLERGY